MFDKSNLEQGIIEDTNPYISKIDELIAKFSNETTDGNRELTYLELSLDSIRRDYERDQIKKDEIEMLISKIKDFKITSETFFKEKGRAENEILTHRLDNLASDLEEIIKG